MSIEPIQIESTAPVRVDLSGGTVDIWPLYLFLNQPKTVNFGIDLFAKTWLHAQPASNPRVILNSQDLGVEETWTWEKVLSPKTEIRPELQLPVRLLRHFSKEHPNPSSLELRLSTKALSPAGAGLGGSSALSISLIGALWKWVHPKEPLDLEVDGEYLIALTRDVESQVLYGPAGLQDYYGAAYGGLQVLEWQIAKNARKSLPVETLNHLSERVLLFYSGKSRNSGINNWQLFKGLIDKEKEVERKFSAIVAATEEVVQGLTQNNFETVLRGVRDEWAARKTLAAGISTEEMNAAFERAKKVSDVAFKVCGAGGGGCFFILLPNTDPKLKQNVRAAVLEDSGIRALDFKPVPHGLSVKKT